MSESSDEPAYRQIQSTVAARVADELRARIRTGELEAGLPLRQNEMAAQFGVSSTPVREAFQLLEREGLVHRVERRGVVVFRPTLSDLVGAFEIRAALESLAARRAASRLSALEIGELEALMKQMSQPSVSDDDFIRLNGAFHQHIAVASGDQRLATLISDQQRSTRVYMVILGVEPSSAQAAEPEHRAIHEALSAGDEEAAARAMATHLELRKHAFQERLTRRDASS